MVAEIIPNEIINPIILAAILGGTGWLTRMFLCFRKVERRTWRQSQAIALIAQAQDEAMEQYHPRDKNKLYIAVDRILKDDDGKY